MRCALFFDATRQIQAAWYDAEASVPRRVSFSELRARVRSASEKECLIFVEAPNRRLRAAAYRAGFNDVVFIDPVSAAIREWVAADEGAASAKDVVVLQCETDGSLRWELRVLSADTQAFVVPADDDRKTRGGFVPALPGTFDVGLERFLDWFQHQECSNVILTGAGIENVELTDELAMLLSCSVFRCEHASVLGGARPTVESKYRICDRWITDAEAALEAGSFDKAIDALKRAESVFDVPPTAVQTLGFDIRRALLGAADAVADEDKPGYLKKALLVPYTLSETPDESDAHIYAKLVYCYCRLGDYISAEESALAVEYLDPTVYKSLGDIGAYITKHRLESFKAK